MTTAPARPRPAPSFAQAAITPVSALAAACLGGSIALAAAACISFTALCDLGRHAGLHHLAALLPIAIDAFAASTLFVAYRLPNGHHARKAAGRTARLALALTVGCNALDHLLDLAGYLLTPHARDLLLVAVASLPPLIVERLLHLQTALVGDYTTSGEAETVNIAVTGNDGEPDDVNGANGRSGDGVLLPMACTVTDPTSPGGEGLVSTVDADADSARHADHGADQAIDESVRTGKMTGQLGQTGRNVAADRSAKGPVSLRRTADEQWLAIAVPVYNDLADRLGRRPSETVFHSALAEALTAQTGTAIGKSDTVTGQNGPTRTLSLSTAKRVRALVEATNQDGV